MSISRLSPADIVERRTATATFDRNVVVTASAGTGKTTLLVNRLLYVLLYLPEPVPAHEIVVLTFTNKAAGEVRARLLERLTACAAEGRHPIDEAIAPRASMAVIQSHAATALRDLDRCVVDTFHGFAASLLRRRPLEAGVDPQFREDDGRAFEDHFQETWFAWLTVELAADAPQRDVWRKVLSWVSLGTLREMALALCAETVDLASFGRTDGVYDPICTWLETMEQMANDLLATHPEDRKIVKQVRAAREVIRAMRTSPDAPVPESIRVALYSLGSTVTGTHGWDDPEVKRARALVQTAHRLAAVDPESVRAIVRLLTPFVDRCRRMFIERGWMSFDGLLVCARNLLRDHPTVRREVKRRYRVILVDELQDTDPIQYEILSYMVEAEGAEAADWRQVRLASGKLFVVGDPKQSIYAFRGADISAYRDLIDRMLAQGAVHCRLTTHFRSHPALVSAINTLAAPLIQPIPRLQPEYDPLVAAADCGGPLPFRTLSIHPVVADDDADAEDARRTEAAALAQWLSSDVIGRAAIRDRTGAEMLVRPGDVTILIRSLASVQLYAEALRRRGIPCRVEGDRHLFAAQEVIDVVNLLRVVADPTDRVALVGLLRSPVGGLTDAAIWHLHQNGWLDDRVTGDVGEARELYDLLQRLRAVAVWRPASDALQQIFEATPVIALAAGREDGAAAVARIQRLQQIVLSIEGTFQARVAWLARQVVDGRDAPEATSLDLEADVVSLMTIHKAKGLEFPVVVLAGCHAVPTGGSQKEQAQVWRDATDGLTGLRVGGLWDLAGVYLADLESRREEEEEKRVLYVALTRASEHLALSFCQASRPHSASYLALFGNRSPTAVLDDAVRSESVLSATSEADRIDLERPTGCKPVPSERAVGFMVQASDLQKPEEMPETFAAVPAPATRAKDPIGPFDLERYLLRWGRRREAPPPPPRFIHPSDMMDSSHESRWEREAFRHARHSGKQVGIWAHRFLEQCDFSLDPQTQAERLRQFLNRQPEADDAPTHASLAEIFETFFQSEIYRILGRSRILCREAPILMAQQENNPSGQIVDGRVDLIYENDGGLFVADYKTDQHLTPDRYRQQAETYVAAVRRSLRRAVTAFQWIDLRRGKVISMPMHGTGISPVVDQRQESTRS